MTACRTDRRCADGRDDGGANAGEAYVIFGSAFWLP
jgi:hypothetical protein